MRGNKAGSGYRWFVAGTMLGAMGAGLGMGMSDSRKMRKVKRNTAKMATRMSREAGHMIGSLGDAVAHKMR